MAGRPGRWEFDDTLPQTEDSAERGHARTDPLTHDPVTYQNLGRSESLDVDNVGDLAEWAADETLVPFLREQGIRSVAVQIWSDTAGHCWEFDDRLFDEMEINAANDRG